MPELLAPAFARCSESDIGDAVLRLLQSDAALRDFFGPRIEAVESEELAFEGSIGAPSLFVALGASQERRLPTDSADLEVEVTLWVVVDKNQFTGTDGWLRARVISHIKALLSQNHGELTNEAGELITDALTIFRRASYAQRLREASNLLATPLTALFSAQIDLLTREFER